MGKNKMLRQILCRMAIFSFLIGQIAHGITLQGTIYDRIGRPLNGGAVRIVVYCGDWGCGTPDPGGFYTATSPVSSNGTYFFGQIPDFAAEIWPLTLTTPERNYTGPRLGFTGDATTHNFQIDGYELRLLSGSPKITDLNQKFSSAFPSGNLIANSSFEGESYIFQGQSNHGWVGRWGGTINRLTAQTGEPGQFGRHFLKVVAGTANFEGQHEGAKYIITEEDPAFAAIQEANAAGRGFTMSAWVRASSSAIGRTIVLGNIHTQGDLDAFTFTDQNWHKISHTFTGAQVHPNSFAFRYYGFSIHESDNSSVPFTFYIDEVLVVPGGPSEAKAPQLIQEFVDGEAKPLQSQVLSQAHGTGGVTRSVSRTDYDALGRPSKVWLPFFEGCAGEACAAISTTDPNALYQGGTNGLPDAGGYAYKQSVYQADPLARIFETGMPGAVHHAGSGHTIITRPSGTNSLTETDLGANRANPDNTENATYSYEHNRDEDGRETMVWSDQLGKPIKKSSAQAGSFVATSSVYDEKSNLVRLLPPISCTDVNGSPTPSPNCVYPTEYSYNQQSQLVRENSPDFGAVKFAYNVSGELRAKQTAVQALQGEFTVFKYDKLSRLVETGVFKGRIEAYDGSGDFDNAIAGKNELLQPELYSYTSLEGAYADVTQKLLKKTNTPVFPIYQVAYDPGEEVVPTPGTEFTPAVDAYGQAVGFEFTGISDEDALYAQLRQERATNGQLPGLEDPAWPTGADYTVQTRNVFDDEEGLPHDVKEANIPFIHPPGEGPGFSKGKLVASINYNPHLSGFWPEVRDRLVSQYYQYNSDGRIIRAFRYIGTIADEQLRLQETESTYDKLGSVVSSAIWKNSSGSTCSDLSNYHRLERDGFNRLSKVFVLDETNCAQEKQVARYFYLPNGQLEKMELGSGASYLIISFEYHIRNWLKGISAKVRPCPAELNCAEEEVFSEELKYESGFNTELAEEQFNGNIAELTYFLGQKSETREFAYIYDGLNRLQRAYYSSDVSQNDKLDASYAYLADGRIKNMKRGGGEVTLSQPFQYFPGSNKLMCVNEQIDADPLEQVDRFCEDDGRVGRYAYNRNGNMIEDGTPNRMTIFEYDWRDLPWKVSKPDGGQIMVYDADGSRVSKFEASLSGATWQFTNAKHYIGGEKEIHESLDGEPATEINNLRGAGLLGRRLPGNQFEYYINNHLGSLVTKVAEGEDWRTQALYDYFPFGKQVLETRDDGPSVTETFTGKELDATLGLYYFGARYYNPDLGMWISPDPVREFHSPYAYGPGNPVNGVDTDGRIWTTIEERSYTAFNIFNTIMNAFAGSEEHETPHGKASGYALLDPANRKGNLRVVKQRWVNDPGCPECDAQYRIGTERQIPQMMMSSEQAVQLLRDYDAKNRTSSLIPMDDFMWGPFVPSRTYLFNFPGEKITHVPDPNGNVSAGGIESHTRVSCEPNCQ